MLGALEELGDWYISLEVNSSYFTTFKLNTEARWTYRVSSVDSLLTF